MLGAGYDDLLSAAEERTLEAGDARLLGKVVLVEVRLVEQVVAEVALVKRFEHLLLSLVALGVCVQRIFDSEE